MITGRCCIRHSQLLPGRCHPSFRAASIHALLGQEAGMAGSLELLVSPQVVDWW